MLSSQVYQMQQQLKDLIAELRQKNTADKSSQAADNFSEHGDQVIADMDLRPTCPSPTNFSHHYRPPPRALYVPTTSSAEYSPPRPLCVPTTFPKSYAPPVSAGTSFKEPDHV